MPRDLIPLPCACGCGEMAAVDNRRNRVSKYVTGHNSRVSHPMKGRHHTDETRAKLAAYVGSAASTYKHGWSTTPTWKSWKSMHERCTDPRNASYSMYGGKGITVDPRWDDFLNFLADMGARPDRTWELDRIDPTLGYGPRNCRWLLAAENRARRRDGWAARRASH